MKYICVNPTWTGPTDSFLYVMAPCECGGQAGPARLSLGVGGTKYLQKLTHPKTAHKKHDVIRLTHGLVFDGALVEGYQRGQEMLRVHIEAGNIRRCEENESAAPAPPAAA